MGFEDGIGRAFFSVPRMRRWILPAARSALVCLAITAIVLGLQVRREAWTFSQGAHFRGDINNAFIWGKITDEHGLFHLYDDDEAANPGLAVPRFTHQSLLLQLKGKLTDYTPLRLAIAQAYYRWAHRKFPEATGWQDTYEFTWPLLWANTSAELASTILVYLIILMWRKRCAESIEESRARRHCMAALGAMLLWFNPAVIWDGHCWPQWDIWPVPLFLGAVLLATMDWWLMAGVCLSIGASLKGQMLLAAPVLLLWPVFQGRFGRGFRLVAGFSLTTAFTVLPWMLPSAAAVRWLVLVTLAMAWASLMSVFYRPRWRWIGVAMILPVMLLAWPWGSVAGAWHLGLLINLMLCGCLSARFIPRGYWLPTFAVLISASIILVIPLYGASSSWYRLGFKYGTEKFDWMVTGSGAYNVPRMLMVYEHWPLDTTDPVTIPIIRIKVTFTQMTRMVYGICLLMCGLGAAIHDRRRNPRFLVAMVAPWLLFFVMMTQMHGRYTIWAAAIGALLAGADVGLALLGVIVSIVSCAGIVENQLLFARRWSPRALSQLESLDPALGFVLLLIATILLYLAITPQRVWPVRRID